MSTKDEKLLRYKQLYGQVLGEIMFKRELEAKAQEEDETEIQESQQISAYEQKKHELFDRIEKIVTELELETEEDKIEDEKLKKEFKEHLEKIILEMQRLKQDFSTDYQKWKQTKKEYEKQIDEKLVKAKKNEEIFEKINREYYEQVKRLTALLKNVKTVDQLVVSSTKRILVKAPESNKK